MIQVIISHFAGSFAEEDGNRLKINIPQADVFPYGKI